MRRKRTIIKIDEERCNGCGQCLLACAEGALALVEGKARLVGEIYCDGLGACLGECPTGALTLEEREADEFNEEAVKERLKETEDKTQPPRPVTSPPPAESLPCGCPGSLVRMLKGKEGEPAGEVETAKIPSELRHWPIKLQLLGPQAPFLQGSHLLLMADCSAVSFPALHQKILRGKTVAIGCPKLDNLEAHIERLAAILKGAHPLSLTVVHMEVPCCRGFVFAAQRAMERSGMKLPLKRIQIGIRGEIQEEEELIPASPPGPGGESSMRGREEAQETRKEAPLKQGRQRGR